MKVYTLRAEKSDGSATVHGVTASQEQAQDWIDEELSRTVEEFDLSGIEATNARNINFVCDDDNWEALLNRFSRQLAEFQYTASLVVLQARESGRKISIKRKERSC